MLTEVDRESSRLRASTLKQVSALWAPSRMLPARVTTASVTCTCLELLLLSVSLSVIVAQVHAGTCFNTLLISDLVLVKFEAVGKTSRQTLLFDRLLYWTHIVWTCCHHYDVRDVVTVPGLLPIFFHGCKRKSGSGLGTRLDVPHSARKALSILSDILR